MALFDHAYERMDGWRQLRDGMLTPEEFRATVSAAHAQAYTRWPACSAPPARAGIDPKQVINLMAENISWRRNERVEAEDGALRHPDFEATLVRTTQVLDEAGNTIG